MAVIDNPSATPARISADAQSIIPISPCSGIKQEQHKLCHSCQNTYFFSYFFIACGFTVGGGSVGGVVGGVSGFSGGCGGCGLSPLPPGT
jgi:hypothetical protein